MCRCEPGSRALGRDSWSANGTPVFYPWLLNPDSGFQLPHSFAWIPEFGYQTLAFLFMVPGFRLLVWGSLLFQTAAFGFLASRSWAWLLGLRFMALESCSEIPLLGLLASNTRTWILGLEFRTCPPPAWSYGTGSWSGTPADECLLWWSCCEIPVFGFLVFGVRF